jgi:uncharacterized protein YndB with AHSA1/START domain
MTNPQAFNPETDLILERTVDVSPEQVWAAWTQPELLKKWFAPRPWTTPYCEIDLRPGGICSTTMRSPEGQDFPNVGVYLEVIENRKLVFTDAITTGFRLSENPFFTAIISLEPVALEGGRTGTKYTAHVMHKDAETRQKHADMGFHVGWGTCLDQLVEMAKEGVAQEV